MHSSTVQSEQTPGVFSKLFVCSRIDHNMNIETYCTKEAKVLARVVIIEQNRTRTLPSIKMDQSHINQNFGLNKSGQKFHHRLKEHHKISKRML